VGPDQGAGGAVRRVRLFVRRGGWHGASGTGYALLGGLRFDVSRSERHSLSVIAESGIRYYGGLTTSVPGEAPTRDSGLVVPFMASLLVSYR